jgi:hypothetical protein
MRSFILAAMVATSLTVLADQVRESKQDQLKLARANIVAQENRAPSCPEIAKDEDYFAYINRCGSEPSVYGGG